MKKLYVDHQIALICLKPLKIKTKSLIIGVHQINLNLYLFKDILDINSIFNLEDEHS